MGFALQEPPFARPVEPFAAACAGREVFARCTSEANEIDVRIHKPEASDFAELPGRRE